MITCPECGAGGTTTQNSATAAARVLRRRVARGRTCACGVAAARGGTSLRAFASSKCSAKTAHENRYRAERNRNGRRRRRAFAIARALGPAPDRKLMPRGAARAPSGDGASTQEDPAGPRAKTAELKHPAGRLRPPERRRWRRVRRLQRRDVAAAETRRRANARRESMRARIDSRAKNEGASAPAAVAPRARPNLALDEAAAVPLNPRRPQPERLDCPASPRERESPAREQRRVENSANPKNSEMTWAKSSAA